MTDRQHKAQFRLRMYREDAIAIGPGRIALLEAIGRTGSISAAARSLGMSYRRAWLLVSQTNQSLKQAAVVSSEGGRSGGGSTLTETGLALIRHYRSIERTAMQAAQADIQALSALIAS